jgi:hypothetical protein
MTAPELRAFHLGIVVRSLEQTMKQYSAMFEVENWHRAKGRFNGLEMAYGRGGARPSSCSRSRARAIRTSTSLRRSTARA